VITPFEKILRGLEAMTRGYHPALQPATCFMLPFLDDKDRALPEVGVTIVHIHLRAAGSNTLAMRIFGARSAVSLVNL
jgi:hypothetical protein